MQIGSIAQMLELIMDILVLVLICLMAIFFGMVGKICKILFYCLPIFMMTGCSNIHYYYSFQDWGSSKFQRIKNPPIRINIGIESRMPQKRYTFIPKQMDQRPVESKIEEEAKSIYKFTQPKRYHKCSLEMKIKPRNDSIVEYVFFVPVFHASHRYFYNKKSHIFEYTYVKGEF